MKDKLRSVKSMFSLDEKISIITGGARASYITGHDMVVDGGYTIW